MSHKELKFTKAMGMQDITVLVMNEKLFDDEHNIKMPPEIHGWIIPKPRRTWGDFRFRGHVITVSDPGDEQESIKEVI
jgi:hypothetical protein